MQGYSGWGQRSPDFGHSSLGGPPSPEHARRRVRRWPAWAAAGLLLVAAFLLGRMVVADDPSVAEEIRQRSQAPVLNEARLVDDRLELDVVGPDDVEHYCLESLTGAADGLDQPRCTWWGGGDTPGISVDELGFDADELVGREITVTAHSSIPDDVDGLSGAMDFPSQVVSEPSAPVEITDAR